MPKLMLTLLAAAGLALAPERVRPVARRCRAKPSMPRRTRSMPQYKAQKERCDNLAGNRKDVCMEEAKAQRDIARPTPRRG